MKHSAQVVVIGGGVIGCSVLYHLAKLGWTDCVLLERDELTAGSSWHAAGNIHGLHDNSNISKLQYYTLKLYLELEAETGHDCGINRSGILYLAQTEDRVHQLRIQAAKARMFGVEFDELSLGEAARLNPLVNFDGIKCAMFEADGGNVDPSCVTHAYAKGARQLGASIERFTPVIETNPRPDGSWDVVTPKGTVHAQIIVNAAGLWGREVGKLAGVDLPLVVMEHQYFVTQDIDEVATIGKNLPSVADRDGEYYLRREGKGLLIGAYERDGRFWAENGMPQDFGHELLPDDLERIEDNVMAACNRVPVVADAGIKRVINGPMIWSPDAAALFGPVPELQNYYCCNGVIPGFSQSGGLGSLLAEWIVEGEPSLDVFGWDVARYGSWAHRDFAKARALDCYSHRFKIHFPHEERDAGRPVRTRPVYQKQKELGAQFGLNAGWEHPLWFAKPDDLIPETYGFTRQAWHKSVGDECRALRTNVGVIDISNFAKYRISGDGAADWLDQIVANHVPRQSGHTCLAPLLGKRGGIAGDFTITMVSDDEYLMFGSGMAERFHQRFFHQVPQPESVKFTSLTDRWTGFNIAGPQARALLSRLTNANLSPDAFKFMRSQFIEIAGVKALALRVSFTGDLGWELYVEQADQPTLYQALLNTEAGFDVAPVGSRALMSLRIEKGYGSWGREYSPEYWPQEVGLDRLIKTEKSAFLGRSAYMELASRPPREKLVCFEVDTIDADASGGEPIFLPDGTPAGRVSSGAYSFTFNQSLALGFVKTEFVQPGREFDIAILGQPHLARLLAHPPFDPEGARLRS